MNNSSAAHLLFTAPPPAADAPSMLEVFMYVVLTGIPRTDDTAVHASDAVSDAAADTPPSPPVRESPVLFIIFLPPARQPIPIIREHITYADVERAAVPVSEQSRNINFCPS